MAYVGQSHWQQPKASSIDPYKMLSVLALLQRMGGGAAALSDEDKIAGTFITQLNKVADKDVAPHVRDEVVDQATEFFNKGGFSKAYTPLFESSFAINSMFQWSTERADLALEKLEPIFIKMEQSIKDGKSSSYDYGEGVKALNIFKRNIQAEKDYMTEANIEAFEEAFTKPFGAGLEVIRNLQTLEKGGMEGGLMHQSLLDQLEMGASSIVTDDPHFDVPGLSGALSYMSTTGFQGKMTEAVQMRPTVARYEKITKSLADFEKMDIKDLGMEVIESTQTKIRQLSDESSSIGAPFSTAFRNKIADLEVQSERMKLVKSYVDDPIIGEALKGMYEAGVKYPSLESTVTAYKKGQPSAAVSGQKAIEEHIRNIFTNKAQVANQRTAQYESNANLAQKGGSKLFKQYANIAAITEPSAKAGLTRERFEIPYNNLSKELVRIMDIAGGLDDFGAGAFSLNDKDGTKVDIKNAIKAAKGGNAYWANKLADLLEQSYTFKTGERGPGSLRIKGIVEDEDIANVTLFIQNLDTNWLWGPGGLSDEDINAVQSLIDARGEHKSSLMLFDAQVPMGENAPIEELSDMLASPARPILASDSQSTPEERKLAETRLFSDVEMEGSEEEVYQQFKDAGLEMEPDLPATKFDLSANDPVPKNYPYDMWALSKEDREKIDFLAERERESRGVTIEEARKMHVDLALGKLQAERDLHKLVTEELGDVEKSLFAAQKSLAGYGPTGKLASAWLSNPDKARANAQFDQENISNLSRNLARVIKTGSLSTDEKASKLKDLADFIVVAKESGEDDSRLMSSLSRLERKLLKAMNIDKNKALKNALVNLLNESTRASLNIAS